MGAPISRTGCCSTTPPAPAVELTRHCHAVLPAARHGGRIVRGRLIGHAHPANQNVATILGRELLRSIEVKTGVPQAELAQLILAIAICNVARYRHVASSVYVAAVPTTALEPWGEKDSHFAGTPSSASSSRYPGTPT